MAIVGKQTEECATNKVTEIFSTALRMKAVCAVIPNISSLVSQKADLASYFFPSLLGMHMQGVARGVYNACPISSDSSMRLVPTRARSPIESTKPIVLRRMSG